jgi:hypothetical protein
LPNKGPIQLPPHHVPSLAPIALSPQTIATTLQSQLDINATLLHSIANSLLQTIANCKTEVAITTKQYEDQLHSLKQKVLHYKATFNEPPEGYILNARQVGNFTIPVGEGLYQPAKWIRLNDDGMISGYSTTQGPNKQPYIINLYAEPNHSSDTHLDTLPPWFRHLLTGPGGDFFILQNMVGNLDDWGLAHEITHYQEINNEITALAMKFQTYQWDIDAARASLMLCESHLMFTHAAECVEGLCNLPRKPGAVRTGWRRTNRGTRSTYV